jgi:hypothetical protein
MDRTYLNRLYSWRYPKYCIVRVPYSGYVEVFYSISSSQWSPKFYSKKIYVSNGHVGKHIWKLYIYKGVRNPI